MNKKQRELALKELTKKANADFFAELLKEEAAGDTNNLATDEDAQLKELVKKMIDRIEIHLPGEE